MRNKILLPVLVVGMLVLSNVGVSLAGVEPSPFFPHFNLISSWFDQIGQMTLPEATRDSLNLIDQRLQKTELNDWVTPELATQGCGTIDRILEILTESALPGESAIQLITIMDRISAILFDPQPEPPGYVAQGLTVVDRISWVLFDPQPEPPGLPPDLQTQSMYVMYQVAGVIGQISMNGLSEGTVPGLNALEQLSGHLVDAVVRAKPDKAAAQVNAMFQIAEQLAGY